MTPAAEHRDGKFCNIFLALSLHNEAGGDARSSRFAFSETDHHSADHQHYNWVPITDYCDIDRIGIVRSADVSDDRLACRTGRQCCLAEPNRTQGPVKWVEWPTAVYHCNVSGRCGMLGLTFQEWTKDHLPGLNSWAYRLVNFDFARFCRFKKQEDVFHTFFLISKLVFVSGQGLFFSCFQKWLWPFRCSKNVFNNTQKKTTSETN